MHIKKMRRGFLAAIMTAVLIGNITSFAAVVDATGLPGSGTSTNSANSYVGATSTVDAANTASSVSAQASTNPTTATSVFPKSASAAEANAKMTGSVLDRTDTTVGLGGATITMIRGNAAGQQLSIVIKTSDGRMIVVDGGITENASYLGNYIKTHGGEVDAWLITHPHVDHVGALIAILNNQRSSNPTFGNFKIDNIFYNFAPLSHYEANETANRMPTINEIFTLFAAQPATMMHTGMAPGTTFNIGNVEVKVLNQPLITTVDSGNNTSICYMITINGKRLLILGDLPYEDAEVLRSMYSAADLKADIVQMAHHGQHGASLEFYKEVDPDYVLWPTHKELWDMRNDSFTEDQSVYSIALTKHWIDLIGVKSNYVMAEGNWTLS